MKEVIVTRLLSALFEKDSVTIRGYQYGKNLTFAMFMELNFVLVDREKIFVKKFFSGGAPLPPHRRPLPLPYEVKKFYFAEYQKTTL